MALQLACEQMTTVERVTQFCQCRVEDLGETSFTIDDVIDAASDAIVVVTGGQVKGRCITTVRPCADTSCMCGRPGDGCGCCRLDAIRLPGWAVEIETVKIDGVPLDVGSYGWFDGDGLIRLGADRPTWPGCQKLHLEDTEEGTFSITYEHGILPMTAVMAATELACDLMTGITSKTSRLDRRVISAIMDSVSVEFDPASLGMFDWVQRLAGAYSSVAQPWAWSPEVDGGWTLHTLRPA
jgi:hypothetical protein